jgi:segregation and condensation protein A
MTDSEIPLDITGHEQRERPGESSSDGLPGADEEDSKTEADTDSTARAADTDSTDEATDQEDEVEPVEVLVQLAEEGEIDPWDIDIVEVTDKFLDRLDEADLRTSGRALFYASVLLRMKGDAMVADDEDTEQPPEPWEQAMAADEPMDEPDPFATLEAEMDRRLERKRARGTPQTLDELVRDLRDAERDNWWKESREYDTSDSPEQYNHGTQELDYRSADQFRMDDEPTEADVTDKTHGEDMDAIIEDVYGAVRDQYDQGRAEVLFREISDVAGSRVQTYLGLLFLSHRGRVRLQQDDLFGDLWIQDPNAAMGSDEAVAD